jgi:hypothetical protein
MTVALAATAAAKTSAQTSAPIRVTPRSARAAAYLDELADARGLIGMAGGAALSELRHSNGTDLGDELAQRASQRVVGVSVRHGLAAAMHLDADTRYHFCDCHGFGPRVVHALSETFTTPREGGGGRTLAVPSLAAHYAEDLTATAWNHDRSVGSALGGATLSLGTKALFNIARELTGIGRPSHPDR